MERRKFIGGLPLAVGGALALRTTDSQAQTTSGGAINVQSYGAVGDGVTDNTTAIQNAINAAISSNQALFFPTGQYAHGPLTANGGSMKIFGEGRNNSVLLLNKAGTSITFTNTDFAQIHDIGFSITGNPRSIAGTWGPTMSTNTDNSEWRECIFSGFAESGLYLAGTSSNVQSGHKVIGCFFFGNGGSQLYLTYSADFHIVDNQFGINEDFPTPHPGAGCQLYYGGAGTYKGNYHWSNTIGLSAQNSDYLRILGNRFEMSDQQGVFMQNAVDIIFANNTVHTNSLASNGTYDNAYFGGITRLIVSDNNSFDWTGSSYHRWGINIDAGCSDVKLSKNQCTNFSTSYGPIRIDASILYEVSPDTALSGSTSTTVPAGTSTYLGANGAQSVENATLFVASRKCVVQSFVVDTDIVPGTSQTFSYTLRVNNANTGMIGSSSGGSSWSAGSTTSSPAVTLKPGDVVSISVNTSAGAAAAHHRYFIALSDC